MGSIFSSMTQALGAADKVFEVRLAHVVSVMKLSFQTLTD